MYNESVFNLFSFVVPQFATIPTLEIISPGNITVLEGSTVVLNVKINATPPVNVSNIQWFFNQFESYYSQDITSISLLGDNQTQIELDLDRLSVTFRNVSIRSSGIYTVVATNVAGSGRASFYVEVQSELGCHTHKLIPEWFISSGICTSNSMGNPGIWDK